MSTRTLPILDISPLLELPNNSNHTQTQNEQTPADKAAAIDAVVAQLYDACTQVGFFYIKTPFPELPALIKTIEKYSHVFFNKDTSIKKRIDMTTVGPAWRGFFSVGDEFTSGAPDIKEGIYFGLELDETDPRVIQKLPMHGSNIFPRTGPVTDNDIGTQHESFKYEELEEDAILKTSVLKYLELAKMIGFAIIDGLSLSLSLPRYALRNILFTDTSLTADQALERFNETYDPLCLFRIFNYPAPKHYQQQYDQQGFISPSSTQCSTTTSSADSAVNGAAVPTGNRKIYSVAEHCDYGCVTILYQDDSGGLEVRDIKSGEFIPAPPLENTLVINIGDSFEKMTQGLFVSTPHRVLNKRDGDRISFPFFFDPSFKANLASLVPISPKLQEVFKSGAGENGGDDAGAGVYSHNTTYKRWDGKEIGLQGFTGTYGNYILDKVSKVFPQLAQQVELDPNQDTTAK